MIQSFTYSISQLKPYIHWLYFFHAWGMDGERSKSDEGKKLSAEAELALCKLESKTSVHTLFRLCNANSMGDSLLLDDVQLPLLRQQKVKAGEHTLCLSDFVKPRESQITDKVGVFATTVEPVYEKDETTDTFATMMRQTLCDRLAEAAAELLHRQVRKELWGYAPDESLSIEELFACKYQGIRPAVGYPSLPDISVNNIIDSLLHFKTIGITLTENGMMNPHASVSGLMISHPASHYFAVGDISQEQAADYAARRGMSIEQIKKYLSQNIL